MTVVVSPLFTLIYTVLSNQSVYVRTHCNDCRNLEETKSLTFSRKVCQSFEEKKTVKPETEKPNVSYPTKNPFFEPDS